MNAADSKSNATTRRPEYRSTSSVIDALDRLASRLALAIRSCGYAGNDTLIIARE